MQRIAISLLFLALLPACALLEPGPEAFGSRHTHRFQLPPEQAARCFARNAEARSSALVSDVQVERDGHASVIVRVRNGVTYATADLQRAGGGSTGRILMMVRSSNRLDDPLRALVEGC